MEEELAMIEKNKTWRLVDKSQDRKIIGVKWTPTSHSLFKKWRIFQLDVKTFSKWFSAGGDLCGATSRFCDKGHEDKVYLLKKALYGLKQAPRAWYNRVDDHLQGLGFKESLSESTLYVRKSNFDIVIISLYVDDLLVPGSNLELIEEFKIEMKKEFEMTDLGEMSYFLGIQIQQSQNAVLICQKKYAKEILKKFKMEECKAMNTPMNPKEKLLKDDGSDKVDEGIYKSIIGYLMYLIAARPDILQSASVISRFLNCASEMHMKVAKRAIRYVKGALDYGIKFTKCQNFKLQGYSDSDWAGSADDMKSTSGYCFNFGSGCFSWCSKKKDIVAQSTAEAEFIAATAAAN
ncbi:uncharacterized mitochondrial protein AtMg00810-like [Hevea brasiliensis]|uniref:uncharacterized mitochondrial protein AtMg00810-like n=1 Tax=Hevea brasiliensis TaxID=3981 RepID=UPI0025E0ED0F|nr:uncharacterized mitochondrial protein AtMg00810-like [Hevea brasiliensis]